MKSYATIDRIEGDYAICELELIDIKKSKSINNIFDIETKMIELPIKPIKFLLGSANEQNIIVVENFNSNIIWIYYRDEEEEKRRIDLLKKIMNK